MENLRRLLPTLPHNLQEEITTKGMVKTIPTGMEILREGQYVKMIPLVLEGVIKVFSSYEEKELLLYYIKPEESCIMSFAAGLKGVPSKVFAIAEEESRVVLLPVSLVNQWIRIYPALNDLFFGQYHQRYEDLLGTINHLLFDKMDKRLLTYLQEKAEVRGTKLLNIRHHQIASELGTAREVVSRLLKKLEAQGKIRLVSNMIEII